VSRIFYWENIYKTILEKVFSYTEPVFFSYLHIHRMKTWGNKKIDLNNEN
jgi:hypothetical protein